MNCIHLGLITDETAECRACALRGVMEPIYQCAIHEKCSPNRQVKGKIAWCQICLSRTPKQQEPPPPPRPRRI